MIVRLYPLTFFAMPNWVWNEVEIAAPLSQVQAYLFETDDPEGREGWRTHYFNLHELFPKRFEPDDARGLTAWDYDWMLEYIGTKWNPKIDSISEDHGTTLLRFDSAWTAPEKLFRRLHELTGWKIVNLHNDLGTEFDLLMTCEGGSCTLERRLRSELCGNCDKRWPHDDIDVEFGECPLCRIERANYLVTIEPDGAAIINT